MNSYSTQPQLQYSCDVRRIVETPAPVSQAIEDLLGAQWICKLVTACYMHRVNMTITTWLGILLYLSLTRIGH